MGTEDPNRAYFPPRPSPSPFAATQSATPFLSPRPMVGPPPAQQTATPFSSSGPVGSGASAFRPSPQPATPFLSSGPARPVSPSMNQPPPPPPPSVVSASGPFQRFPTPQFPSTAQPLPPHTLPAGQPVFPPPIKPQISSAPIGSPPPTINTVSSGMNFPRSNFQPSPSPIGPSNSFVRGPLQSSLPGYPGKQPNTFPQVPPVQSAGFPSHQGGYHPPPPPASTPVVSHQGGYAPPPVAGPPGLYSRDQMRPPASGPPMGVSQGLIEDFSSLTVGSVPGSFDSGLDPKALPRPLDGDVKPTLFAEMYPMNCDSRYLRLTTSAIPNSQSLASRWHLPLGAVVCPLAEAPDGVR